MVWSGRGRERRLERLESDGHRLPGGGGGQRAGRRSRPATHRKETGGFVWSVGHWRVCSWGGVGVNVHVEKIPLAADWRLDL